MSLTIPFNLGAQTVAAPAQGGLRIPVALFGGAGFGLTASRQDQIVRAVAAIVVVRDPGAALDTALTARETPAAVVADIDESTLRAVLTPIASVAAGRTTPPAANDEHRGLAQALGTNAGLVAAADTAIPKPSDISIAADTGTASALTSARAFVASIDPALLERLARAALRSTRLQQADKAARDGGGGQSEVAQLRTEMTELKRSVDELRATIGGALVVQMRQPAPTGAQYATSQISSSGDGPPSTQSAQQDAPRQAEPVAVDAPEQTGRKTK